jgi:hypothetical protein|tara:strand:+ start:12743 stop:12877 length:135 start_codon:yes stop_codon:yes gene_type:complete
MKNNPDTIKGFIYGQDGKPVPLTVKDTKENAQFMEWLRIHDRSM